MKKDEIALVRIMSVAALLLMQSLILILALGSRFFTRIISSSEDASVYNVFYYTGANYIYEIIFPIAVILTIGAALGVLFKINKSGRCALLGSILSIVTGLFIIVTKLGENVKFIRRMLIGLVVDDVNSMDLVSSNMIGIRFIFAILLIFVAVVTLLLIKSSNINTLKLYNKKKAQGIFIYLLPVLYGTLIIDLIRNNTIVPKVISRLGNMHVGAFDIINTYYYGNRFFFNTSVVYIFGAGLIISLICRHMSEKFNSNVALIISVGTPTIVTAIMCLLFYNNPPALFGAITVDFALCDVVEAGFAVSLIAWVIQVLFINMLNYAIVYNRLNLKPMLIIMAQNIITGLLLLIIMTKTLSLAYVAVIISDVISIVLLIFFCLNYSKQVSNY